ncbi:MAG TPA: hypothetical protein VF316_19245 [Polyangiaceae bacterium]
MDVAMARWILPSALVLTAVACGSGSFAGADAATDADGPQADACPEPGLHPWAITCRPLHLSSSMALQAGAPYCLGPPLGYDFPQGEWAFPLGCNAHLQTSSPSLYGCSRSFVCSGGDPDGRWVELL